MSTNDAPPETLNLARHVLTQSDDAWLMPGWLPRRAEEAAVREAEEYVEAHREAAVRGASKTRSKCDPTANDGCSDIRTRAFFFGAPSQSQPDSTHATAVSALVNAYRTYRRLKTARSSLSWLGFGVSAALSLTQVATSVGGMSKLSPTSVLSLAWSAASMVRNGTLGNSSSVAASSLDALVQDAASHSSTGVSGMGGVYWMVLGAALGVAFSNEARWWFVDSPHSREALNRAKAAARDVERTQGQSADARGNDGVAPSLHQLWDEEEQLRATESSIRRHDSPPSLLLVDNVDAAASHRDRPFSDDAHSSSETRHRRHDGSRRRTRRRRRKHK